MGLTLFYAVANIVLVVYIISIVVLLILDNRDPDKTVGWVLIFLLFPVIGLIIYFYLGQNWKKKNFIKNFQSNELYQLFKKKNKYECDRKCSNAIKSDPIHNKISKAVENTSGFIVTDGNSCRILQSGREKFSLLKKELKKAKRYIHMEYYILKDDKIGSEIKDILIMKAKQGISVRVLYDFVGSFKLSRRYKEELKAAGVILQSFFNPLKFFAYHKLNFRTHRKIVIIDGTKAFIGGMNIGDYYIDGGNRFKSWRDLHMFVEGNIVHQIETVFLYDWYLTTRKSILIPEYYPRIEKSKENKALQVSYSGPESIWQSIKQVFFILITNAKKSIYITTPYFIPDTSLFMALKNAALSGIDIRIIVPSKPDFMIPFHASRTYFKELMEAGVKFYEYTGGFIHSKAVIVDSTIATTGTANFDIRSLQVNFDINLVIYDKRDVNTIEKFFMQSLSKSRYLEFNKFIKRRISKKLVESVARLLSPVL